MARKFLASKANQMTRFTCFVRQEGKTNADGDRRPVPARMPIRARRLLPADECSTWNGWWPLKSARSTVLRGKSLEARPRPRPLTTGSSVSITSCVSCKSCCRALRIEGPAFLPIFLSTNVHASDCLSPRARMARGYYS